MRFGGILLTAAMALAQSPTFDVASVKLYKDDGKSPRNSHSTYGPQGIDLGARPLAFIISEAYAFPPGRVVPASSGKEAILGLLRQGYDIVAKSDHAVPKEQLKLMLQSLLADRFQLTMHRESRTMPVYKLVVAKSGPKLEESEGGDLVMGGGPDGFQYRNAEVFRLCGHISSYVDRVVVDETGLKGLYNFVVKIPEDLRQNPQPKQDGKSPDSPSAALFAEVLKPLGLQLVGGTAPVEYLVVDRVERPSEN